MVLTDVDRFRLVARVLVRLQRVFGLGHVNVTGPVRTVLLQGVYLMQWGYVLVGATKRLLDILGSRVDDELRRQDRHQPDLVRRGDFHTRGTSGFVTHQRSVLTLTDHQLTETGTEDGTHQEYLVHGRLEVGLLQVLAQTRTHDHNVLILIILCVVNHVEEVRLVEDRGFDL